MKIKICLDWKKAVIFLLVSGGLVYLTRSVLMSVGVLMLLFVADALIASYEYRRQTHRIFDELRSGKNEGETRQDENDRK